MVNFMPGMPRAHEQIQMIQRAGAHPQQHFVGFDLRLGHVFVDQHFGPAVLVDACGFHE